MKYTIVVDKQSRTNPSDERKEITFEIDELRKKGEIHDDLIIENGQAKVIRRIVLSKYNVTSILENEVIEELGEASIPLFEGDNYIYVKDEYNNQMCAEYIVKSDFTDMYVTRLEMKSEIEQTAQGISMSVNKKLEGYTDTEEMKALLKVEAEGITSEVSKQYATKDEMSSSITQTANEIKSIVSVSIGTVNLVSNSDFSHRNSSGQYDLKNWIIDNNETDDPVVVKGEKAWLHLFKQTSGSMSATQILKPINKNEYYTLSFKLINQTGFAQSVGMVFSLKSASGESIKSFDYWPTINTSNKEQRFNYTFQTPNNDNINYLDFGIQTYNSSSSYTDVLITDIQLEIGKIATEWRASQTDYYNKIEQYSKVVQTVDLISTEVKKKVGNDEIISKINQSAEKIRHRSKQNRTNSE